MVSTPRVSGSNMQRREDQSWGRIEKQAPSGCVTPTKPRTHLKKESYFLKCFYWKGILKAHEEWRICYCTFKMCKILTLPHLWYPYCILSSSMKYLFIRNCIDLLTTPVLHSTFLWFLKLNDLAPRHFGMQAYIITIEQHQPGLTPAFWRTHFLSEISLSILSIVFNLNLTSI